MKESAQRTLLREYSGIRNLVSDAVFCMNGRDPTLYKGCLRVVKENVLVYTADRRAWLARRGIKPRDVDGAFNSLFAGEMYDMVVAYIKRHNLAIVKKGNGYTLVKR